MSRLTRRARASDPDLLRGFALGSELLKRPLHVIVDPPPVGWSSRPASEGMSVARVSLSDATSMQWRSSRAHPFQGGEKNEAPHPARFDRAHVSVGASGGGRRPSGMQKAGFLLTFRSLATRRTCAPQRTRAPATPSLAGSGPSKILPWPAGEEEIFSILGIQRWTKPPCPATRRGQVTCT